MRAQFATIEALVSLLVVLSAVSFVSWEISLNTRSVGAERSRIAQSMAAYDFFEQIAENKSTNDCAALSSATRNAGCLNTTIDLYKEAFGISQFGVALPGLSVGNATGGVEECLPIHLSSLNLTSEVCITEGS
jgi:hypothetical protein